MKAPSIYLNLSLVLLTLVIPRIPPGDEAYGDPILQILYLVLILPVMATLLNLILANTGKNSWPQGTTCLVCLGGCVAAYTKWVLQTGQSFFQTDSEMTFAFLLLASLVLSTVLFGMLRITGSGRLAKTAEES